MTINGGSNCGVELLLSSPHRRKRKEKENLLLPRRLGEGYLGRKNTFSGPSALLGYAKAH